jgi:hypothetical protein
MLTEKEINDNKIIYDLIEKDKPIAVGKIGANELNYICLPYMDLDNNIKNILLHNILFGAGLYPNNSEIINQFLSIHYLSCFKEVDVFAEWNKNKACERNLINLKAPKSIRVELRSLEPYYFDLKWTKFLENKKILIISPFTKSISLQLKIKDKIWTNNLLPDFEAKLLKFPLSYYLQNVEKQKDYPNTCIDLLNLYKEKMESIDFDIALIGTGIYGLPLAVHAKKLGKIGYHFGGALQVLFGIKGKRWDNYSFYNEYWIRPSDDEIPFHKDYCENGCYW